MFPWNSAGNSFPIPKGNLGSKIVSVEDFRGISVCPLIFKILERGILEKFAAYLKTSDNKFGFKKGLGCSHAVFCLNSVFDYFVKNGSTVSLCSLDVAKAFDRVNHYSLFYKLVDRNIPINFVIG